MKRFLTILLFAAALLPMARADISIQLTPNADGTVDTEFPNGDKGGSQGNLFIAEGGSDANPCTAAQPCATVGHAMDIATPGDVIEMRATGGTWTIGYVVFDECGAPNQEIVLRVRAGDRVNFYPSGPAPGRDAVWNFLGTACYLFLDGSLGEMHVGDRSLWTGTNGGTANYPHNYALYGDGGSHHIHIRGVNFSGGEASAAMQLENTTHHWFFENITGGGHGRVTDSGTHNDDGLRISGDHHLIVGGDLSAPFGGHNSGGFFANWQVIRGVTFNMDWGSVTDQSENSGYRAFTVGVNTALGEGSSTEPWGPSLIEDNIVRNAGWVVQSGGSNNNSMWKLGAWRTIARYNHAWDIRSHNGGSASTALPQPVEAEHTETAEHGRVYNNTYFNVEKWLLTNAGPGVNEPYNDLQDRRYFNNMLGNVTGIDNPLYVPFNDHLVFYFNVHRLALQGHPNHWLGSRFECNYIDAPPDAQSIRLHDSTATGAGTAETLADAKTMWPNVWAASNQIADPIFVDAASRTKAGFALAAGSPGEGDACAMATVTAPSTGTTVALSDAWWIYDGANPASWDLAYYGEQGDWIAFFDSSGAVLKGIRQVFSVDNQTQVTLTAGIDVAAGDLVFAVLADGTTIVRDVGATQ